MHSFEIYVIIVKKGRRNRMFRKNIEPSCSYCKKGNMLSDGNVLCKKYGLIQPKADCKKFSYCSLKRIPGRPAELPEFESLDFSIN